MFKGSRNPKLYLKDILDECKNIRTFVDGVKYDEFTDNIEKVYAVAKAFENIGEAVKNIPKELTQNHTDVPWSDIAKMRDVLTHHYFGLDDKVLWDTLGEDFDLFENAVSQILKKYEYLD